MDCIPPRGESGGIDRCAFRHGRIGQRASASRRMSGSSLNLAETIPISSWGSLDRRAILLPKQCQLHTLALQFTDDLREVRFVLITTRTSGKTEQQRLEYGVIVMDWR